MAMPGRKLDRAAFARRNWKVLVAFFAACVICGGATGRLLLALTGIVGLGWVWLAHRKGGA